MADWLRAAEFACKTARSLIVGKGAPTLPGPLDDGDLLAAAEEEREVWEPSATKVEKCIDCGQDFELGHYAHCKGPWWVERAVEAKAAKERGQLVTLDEEGVVTSPGPFHGIKLYVPEVPFKFKALVRMKTPDAAGATAAAGEDPPRGVEEAPRGADSKVVVLPAEFDTPTGLAALLRFYGLAVEFKNPEK